LHNAVHQREQVLADDDMAEFRDKKGVPCRTPFEVVYAAQQSVSREDPPSHRPARPQLASTNQCMQSKAISVTSFQSTL